MSAHTWHKHLLSTTVLVGALTAYGRSAYAACVSTPPDPPNVFVCTGTETTPQSVNFNNAIVGTAVGFEVDTNTGDALTITGLGAIVFRDENASPLTSDNDDALVVRSNGDAMSVAGSVTIETNGKLVAEAIGINAFNMGLGVMSITANGDIESITEDGIVAFNLGSDLTVTTGGTINARDIGINAENRGNGATLITVNGDITTIGDLAAGIRARNGSVTPAATTSLTVITESGTTIDANRFGIDARNYGFGALTITARGQVTGALDTGIYAQNGNNTLSLGRATDIIIKTEALVTGGDYGIFARNYGTGELSVTAEGDVEGTNNAGIYARIANTLSTSDLTIIADGVTGGNFGIRARHNGRGALSVTTEGDVEGTDSGSSGIDARIYSNSATGNLTITAAGVIGASYGIRTHNYGMGALEVIASGEVEGTNSAGISARIANALATGDLTIIADGVTGGNYGIRARNYGMRAIEITANGDVGRVGGMDELIPTTGIFARNGTNVTAAGTDIIITTEERVTATNHGFYVRNFGSGEIKITAKGAVEGTNVAGIFAAVDNPLATGDLTIESAAVTGSSRGIQAYNNGTGSIEITAHGDVGRVEVGNELIPSTGIFAQNGDSLTAAGKDIIITTEALVTGSNSGIFARNFGEGELKITAEGEVEGSNLVGIYARNFGTNLTIDTASVSGYQGINARNNGTGAFDITVNGDIVGNAADGIYAGRGGAGAIAITVAAAGSVTSRGGGLGDFAVETTEGGAELRVAGTLNGGVVGGAVRFDQTGDFDNRFALQTSASVNGTVFGGVNAGTDTLALEGGGQGAFNVGQLVNFETGEKTGNGHWTLTGTNTEIEDFAVNAGLLAVNGAMPNTAFTVTGGTLGGTGIVGATTIAGNGVFAPGNSIGTMRVNGAFTLSPGAVFEAEVNAAGQGDKVIVNGTVNLTGSVLKVIAASGDYKPKTDYLIIDNDGTDPVQGPFGAVFTNLAFLIPQVDYRAGDGNDVVLTLLRTVVPDNGGFVSFCSVATTPNQCKVAHALDRFPEDDPLFLAVLLQTVDGARQAFDALSGEIHATLPGVLADDSRYVREAVLGRMTQASYTGGLAALGAAGPQVASQAMMLAPDSEPMMLGSEGKSLAAPAPDPGLAFWTRAYGAWGDFDGNRNAASAERDLGGFVSGVDAQVSDTWRVGLATGGAWSNVSVGGRNSSAEVESFHLAAYTGGMAGPLALRAGGAWSWQDIDTSRAVVFPGFFERQEASYDADTGQLFGEIAYPIASRGIAFEPFVGLAYVNVDTERFGEHGGALSALTGASSDQDVGYSTLGLRAATALHWGTTLVVPKVSAAWQHAFDDVTPRAALAFASNGIGFGITGVPLAQDSLLLEAGLDLALSPTATLGVSYSGQLASDVQDTAVKGRLTWQF